MSDASSVLLWLESIRSGDEAAINRLWAEFSPRMTSLAQSWLARTSGRRIFDEEDVVVTAFEGFRRALAEGRYEGLTDNDEMWRLLAAATVNKAIDFSEGERAQKRGGGERIESLDDPTPSMKKQTQQQASQDPSPEFAAMMSDECRRLLEILKDPELEALVLLKLEGFSNDEIAQQFGYSRRTIQRMLASIRNLWGQEID
jgi:RNA polymerase sigma factor (sigma-70 family)